MYGKYLKGIFLVAIVLGIIYLGMYLQADESRLENVISGGKGILSLKRPVFLSDVAAIELAQVSAFPSSEVGMCAYVNVGSINLENATRAFTQILNLSGTHTIGIIPISNWVATDSIHVYMDTSGWIVAYYTNTENAAKIVKWSGMDFNNPTISGETPLSDAINEACNKIGVNYTKIKGSINYYDFRYPSADKLQIVMNTRTGAGTEYIHILLPDTYTYYNISYVLVNSGHYSDANLYVDGGHIAGAGNGGRALGTYLTIGEPHTIQLSSGGAYGVTSGLATVLIYR